MRATISFKVSAAEREHLQRLVADRNTPAKVVWRAKIILGSADGLGTMAIMRATGKSKPCVWRWQERFATEGVDGLVRDKTRPPGRAPLSAAVKRKVLAKTANETPPDATHWSVRTMAKAVGISRTSVQRIWAEAGLKPHLVKRFKISNDPAFEEKVTDVVGLYMNPPDRALVLCVDEKSQIQALDRTQPGLPLKKGRAATMTHDYKRHGTTTLYAALDVRTGLVIGDCKPRHRAREFIAFLKLIDEIVDDRFALHLVVDNYGAHKTAAVKEISWGWSAARRSRAAACRRRSRVVIACRRIAEIARGVDHAVPQPHARAPRLRRRARAHRVGRRACRLRRAAAGSPAAAPPSVTSSWIARRPSAAPCAA